MRTLASLVSLQLSLLLAGGLAAQCAPQWQAGDPLSQVRGYVATTATWDPDGAGPLPLNLVAGGAFAVGAMPSTRIAVFDGTQWSALGTPPGPATRLCTWGGQLVASCGSQYGDILAIWNGSSWQQLAAVVGNVLAMTTFNGDLVVCGTFSSVGGITANRLARWNGATWSPLGSGTTGTAHAMAVYNNLLYVGGSFSNMGGVPVGNLAVWNGSSWSAPASFNGPVNVLGVRNGLALTQYQLFAAGSFTAVGATPAQHIARLTASTNAWTAMGAGLPGSNVSALSVVLSGASSYDVVAGVDAPGSSQKVLHWNGSAWVGLPLVTFNPTDGAPTGITYYGGSQVLSVPTAEQNVRRYDGVSDWVPLRGPGLAGRVYSIDAQGGDLVIGGSLPQISGVTVNHVARGGPGNWQPLGTGMDPAGAVFAVVRGGNGDVYAGGTFATAGGTAASNIARWDGAAWSPLGSGLNGTVYALRVLANGDLVATGAFTGSGATVLNRIARWNGTAWFGLGSGLNAQGRALALAANGDLLVGGDFQVAGSVICNRIARWNGISWSALGAGFDSTVFAVAVQPNGAVAAGGNFQNSGTTACQYLATWNGAQWATPQTVLFRPNADVYTLLALPDGDLVAGGATWSYSLSFPPISINTTIARLDGLTWSSLTSRGTGTWALALDPQGSLVAGGEFHLDTAVVSDNLARMVPPCPATVTGYGSGCSGTGGANVFAAAQLPWLGGTFRGLATGMPPIGFTLLITGLSPIAVPIANLAPQGAPGCTALVAFDSIEFAMPVAGRVATSLAIPDSTAMIGVQIRQQVAVAELGAGGAITSITSTNALQLTIGVL